MPATPVSISAGPTLTAPETRGLARLIQDPLVVVGLDGLAYDCNGPGRALIGADPVQTGVAVFESDEGLRRLLTAASASADPVIGALVLRHVSGEAQRRRVRAVVVDRTPGALRIAVQILDAKDDQFALLSSRVKELNQEIGVRRAIQARLEETLERNGVLYRELQHRVKNHLQMMLGLFSTARREAASVSDAAFLQQIEAKLHVVFEAQRLMYASESAGVPAAQLLSSTTGVLAALAGDGLEIEVQADAVTISNDVAFPLALIINELVSNAVKYGVRGGVGRISVKLTSSGEDIELQVRDHGPGFRPGESPERRSSGLGLVRGLCRQIGGGLRVESDDGAVVTVLFRNAG